MLQSIPDPFDSYGPPKSEDQIFSILPPLSIFNAPSSSPSPQSATTEIDPTPAFATGSMSWTNAHDVMEPSQSEWADVRTPTSSPPPSVKGVSNIIRATSPTGSSHRSPSHTVASSSNSQHTSQSRKSESKLRKVLSVISESPYSSESSAGASNRPSSAETIRVADTEMNGQAGENLNGDAVWGSHVVLGADLSANEVPKNDKASTSSPPYSPSQPIHRDQGTHQAS